MKKVIVFILFLLLIMPAVLAYRESIDISIKSASIENDYVVVGEDAIINITITCTGGDAGEVNVSLFLNDKNTPICGTPFINVELMNDDTKYITATWNTTKISSGKYTLIIVADANNSISEANESNNEYLLNVSVYPARLPDLVIESDDIEMPSEAYIGDEISIRVKVWNKGIASAKNVDVALYDEETKNSICPSSSINEILPGEYKNATFVWNTSNFQSGNYTIIAAADPYQGGSITELNESNNNATAEILLKETYINVSILNITMMPENPRIGEKVSFTITFKNSGNKIAENYTVKYYIDGAYITMKYLRIPAYEFVNDSFILNTSDYPEGNHTLLISHGIDIEKNYTYNFTLFPLPLPDLTIHLIKYDAKEFYIGDIIKFEVIIKNIGNATADNVEVWAYADMDVIPLINTTIEHMGINSSEKVLFEWNTSTYKEGPHHIRVMIDPRNRIAEESERNNINKTSIYLNGIPNLQFGNVTYPEIAFVNMTVRITVVIINNGTGSTNCETSVSIYVDNKTLSSKTLSPLVAGGIQTYVISWVPTSIGAHKFECIIDAENKVHEINEDDNMVEFFINVTHEKEPPDIIIENVSISPPVIYEDVSIEVAVRISNIGSDLEANSTISLYLRAEGKNEVLVDSQRIDEMKSHECRTIYFYISAGDYYPNRYSLIVVVQLPAGIEDRNLTNNRYEIEIEILKRTPVIPDLKIVDIIFNPREDEIEEGESVGITVKISNSGGGVSGVIVQMYIDGNISMTRTIQYLGGDESADVNFETKFSDGRHTITFKVSHGETGVTVKKDVKIDVKKSISPDIKFVIAAVGVLFFVVFMAAFGIYRIFLSSPKRKYRVRLLPYEEE